MPTLSISRPIWTAKGEAIAWHLREAIGGDNDRYRRVVFNEITKKSIQEAFKQPSELDMSRVNAQQARRFLDRVVGYMVSPLLWEKVARGLSAGRVQSVVVRLVVEREREIRSFIPEEFWEMHLDASSGAKELLRLQVNKYLVIRLTVLLVSQRAISIRLLLISLR